MTLTYGSRQACDETRIEASTARIPCPQRDKPWVLATAIVGSSLAFIEGSVVNLALPSIQSHFDATSIELQWVVNAYLLTLGSFMLVGGSLGDRYGLRRIFLLGTGIFGLGALACAFAPSLWTLIIARLVQGIGGALLVPTSLALVGSHFTAGERGRAIGTWAGASALTTAIGPVLGGWLVDQWGWPAVFLLVPPLAIITFAMALWRVPRSPARTGEVLDYPGAVLLAAMLVLLIYALVDNGSSVSRFALIAPAVMLGAAFIWWEHRFHAPMLPPGLFRSRSFSGANLMTLLLYCALSGALYFLPFNLIQVQGYSAVAAGAAFLPFTIILGFGSTFAGDLIRRFSPRLVLTIGPVITALGFLALAIPGVDADFVTGFLPGIVMIGIGMTLSVAPLTTVVMDSVGEQQSGIASGVNNTVARLAGVLAVAGLTAIAIATFERQLSDGLQQQQVSPALAGQLLLQASELADLEAPVTAASAVRASVDDIVAQSYVSTFRLLMMACGMLAALSGMIAWLFLGKSGLDKNVLGDGGQLHGNG